MPSSSRRGSSSSKEPPMPPGVEKTGPEKEVDGAAAAADPMSKDMNGRFVGVGRGGWNDGAAGRRVCAPGKTTGGTLNSFDIFVVVGGFEI